MFDVLTDVLEQVRLAGTVYFSAELRAPWGVSVRPEGRAPFYVVTRGGCLLEVDGEPQARALATGDLALLPRAHAHVIRSGPKVPALPFGRFVKEHPMDERGFVRCDGGKGPTSTIVGGFFLSQELEATPLLSALPAVVHLRADDRHVASWLEPTLRFIGVEMGSGMHGSRSVLNRLADILFIQAVRAYLSMDEPIHAGWLKGLSDGHVAKALALIHEHYARPWTLGRLARTIGISRTVLAVRFRTLVGTSPIAYLTRWRMLQAAKLLREPRTGMAEVAEKVGYTSEAAFAKAFKRTLKQTPGEVRRSAPRPLGAA
jgi:AraC-like DNA-binding protein